MRPSNPFIPYGLFVAALCSVCHPSAAQDEIKQTVPASVANPSSSPPVKPTAVRTAVANPKLARVPRCRWSLPMCGGPMEDHAPDFFYCPKRKSLLDRYGRIQDSQSKMILRPGDEFWWVSSRHLPLQSCDGFELAYYQFADCAAQPSSLEKLRAAHQARPDYVNFVYAHENRADLNKSEMRFWQAYNILINEAPDAPPIRFIFFSWPTDRICGQVRDVRAKGDICDFHALYLAWFLCQIQDFNKVSLSGYSYGSRLVLDALHIAGGGSKRGQALPESMWIRRPTFRGAFIATAMQNGCTSEGGLCGTCYQTFDHVTLLNNSRDGVLRFYNLMPPYRNAIGYKGIPACRLADGGKRLTQIDARRIARTSHKLEDYYKSESLRQIVRETLFWRDVNACGEICQSCHKAESPTCGCD